MQDAEPRTLEQMLDFELPESVWDGRDFTNIFCAILFADLEGSVQISRIISPEDYDELIDEFQSAMLKAMEGLSARFAMPSMEINLAGDQLAVFLYNEDCVKFNWLLDSEPRLEGAERKAVVRAYGRSNENVALTALRAAVYIKSSWLSNHINVERISLHREPIGLALGVHADKVFLRQRADGRRRIEGYAVNLAKRVESFSRNGRFSRIMFSQPAANIIRGTVLKHTQLRQRIFFYRHNLDSDQLKGLGRMELYELKFFHRIGIPEPSDNMIELYDKILSHDPTNIWAYYQLSAFYALKGDYDHLERLASRANLVHQDDEKILVDLGLYYFNSGMLGQATKYFQRALEVNPELDLAYEWLAKIYDLQQEYQAAVDNARSSLLLSPNSPVNQMNMGLTLCDVGAFGEAAHHFSNAFETYPNYLTDPATAEVILVHIRPMASAGKVSRELYAQLQKHVPEYAADLPPQEWQLEQQAGQTAASPE